MTEKKRLLDRIMPLLAADGVETCDDDLREELCRLKLSTLHTLHYRIERALANSYEEGQRNGEGA